MSQPQNAPQGQASPQGGLPDEYRLNLLIRSTVIALNQANMTGNYSVLRDLGTPSFQLSNNQAKLAEIFANLRNRKLDLSPIMFFNPKLVSAPAIQDGQVLRLTGFFPTTPEQVNFDLAFQVFAEQWMLAGIAVSAVQATDAQKASQTSSLQSPSPPAPKSAEQQKAGEPKGAAQEPKPNRIDLSEPAPLPAKKPAERKPKPAAQQPAPKPQASSSAAPAQSTSVRTEWQPR